MEPVVGRPKAERRLGRNRLKGVEGDRLNPVLAACGFNFRKLLRFPWSFFEALTGADPPPTSFSLFKILPVPQS